VLDKATNLTGVFFRNVYKFETGSVVQKLYFFSGIVRKISMVSVMKQRLTDAYCFIFQVTCFLFDEYLNRMLLVIGFSKHFLQKNTVLFPQS